MMRHRDDPKFFGGDLIDDAIGKPAKKMAAERTAKYRPQHRIFQNEICGSLKLSHECKPESGIRLCRIEGRSIMQLGECERNNDEFHFNAART